MRYLRLVQIAGRVWRKLYQPKLLVSQKSFRLRDEDGVWVQGAEHSPTLVRPREFLFLNRIGKLEEIGWTGDERSKLWRYNQHYFDDLNSKGSHKRREWHLDLLSDWLECNPPFRGEGWEPYPCSLRIVNLIKWKLSGNLLPNEYLLNLSLQARWLCKNVEIHLLGNHLLANAKALIFAGCFFKSEEADNWLLKGVRIITQEISEQILSDGSHFELSPMYQRIILEDFLDLLNLFNAYPKRVSKKLVIQLKNAIEIMMPWMKSMSHPDGEVSFFNDSAKGIASSLNSLESYASRLDIFNGVPMELGNQIYMEASGYFRWEQGDAVLIGDVACIGPDYIPGHGHADVLSFELSIGRQRVLVNSGTSTYRESTERLRQRGTSAHNTVEINGEDSSEVWKSFRVARRAKAFNFAILKDQGKWIELRCSHDGYGRLFGKNIHSRTWQLSEGELVVRDSIQGPFHSAIARFHLHPDAKCSDNTIVLPDETKIFISSEASQLRIVDSTWHPNFGQSIVTKCLEYRIEKPVSTVKFKW